MPDFTLQSIGLVGTQQLRDEETSQPLVYHWDGRPGRTPLFPSDHFGLWAVWRRA